jgi:elongation factor G
MEPNEAGKGFEFVDAIKGGVVPREFIPAVDKGLQDAVPNGVCRLPGCRCEGSPCSMVPITTSTPTKMHSDGGFDGLQGWYAKASPTLLEPMMAVEVETPEDYMGNVMGDLSSRRGMVQGMEDQVGGIKLVKAEVPLSEMFGYATSLRSLSQGRATYSMEFKHYTEAPKNVAEAVINKK